MVGPGAIVLLALALLGEVEPEVALAALCGLVARPVSAPGSIFSGSMRCGRAFRRWRATTPKEVGPHPPDR